MITKSILSALVVSLCSISSAMAATIVYETRPITNGVNNADYKASWNAQISSITSRTLADFNGATIPGASGGFSHLIIEFNTTVKNSTWSFRLAPDAGYGGAIYLDEQEIDKNVTDLWWGGNWNASSEIFSGSLLLSSVGNHTFEGYWAEGCCNGKSGIQYKIGNSAWQNPSNLASPVTTPIPGAVWLFGSAIVGLIGMTKRKQMTAAISI